MLNTNPLITVILPIRNEARYIKRTLLAVFKQEYPPEKMQILIADGMSTDGTREIIDKLISKYPQYSVKLIDNIKRIAPTGLNIALPLARGEIIVRVDGHCEIAPDYLKKSVQYLQNYDIEGVGGSIETIGETFTAKAVAIAMSSNFGVGASDYRTLKQGETYPDSIVFPAYKRETIINTGLFDEELIRNQDDEYNYRIRSLGGKLLLTSEINSRYYNRTSLSALWRQYFQYGFWKVRVLQKHPAQMRPRQFAPPVFVAALILTSLSTLLTPWGYHAFGLVFGAYAIANSIFSIQAAKRTEWKYLPMLPVVYSILHISYGTGFIVGLVKFINRWGDKLGKVPQWEETSG